MSSARPITRARREGPPSRRYALKASELGIVESIARHANPARDKGARITLIKPPVVFSKNSYSTPLTQPIGLTYLAAVLEKADYLVRIIDCPPVPTRTASCSARTGALVFKGSTSKRRSIASIPEATSLG